MKKSKVSTKEMELRIKILQLETNLALWEERHKLEERFWRVIETLLPKEEAEVKKGG